MSAEYDQFANTKFSNKAASRFDGHDDYASNRDDFKLWINLATLSASKHGPNDVYCPQEEAKTAVKAPATKEIGTKGGVDLILERLGKAFAIDKTNQLAADLAELLE